jgi:hypothetical protein
MKVHEFGISFSLDLNLGVSSSRSVVRMFIPSITQSPKVQRLEIMKSLKNR